MDLLSDHRQRLFRPVLDLHDDPLQRRQPHVQIHLGSEIGNEFHRAGIEIVHSGARARQQARQHAHLLIVVIVDHDERVSVTG